MIAGVPGLLVSVATASFTTVSLEAPFESDLHNADIATSVPQSTESSASRYLAPLFLMFVAACVVCCFCFV